MIPALIVWSMSEVELRVIESTSTSVVREVSGGTDYLGVRNPPIQQEAALVGKLEDQDLRLFMVPGVFRG